MDVPVGVIVLYKIKTMPRYSGYFTLRDTLMLVPVDCVKVYGNTSDRSPVSVFRRRQMF